MGDVKSPQAAYQKRKYAKRKAEGLCPGCGKPAPAGCTYCGECNEKKKAVWRARYARRVSERKCIRCGKPLPEGRKQLYCFYCGIREAEREREKYAARKALREKSQGDLRDISGVTQG